jgi:hypothetical protein
VGVVGSPLRAETLSLLHDRHERAARRVRSRPVLAKASAGSPEAFAVWPRSGRLPSDLHGLCPTRPPAPKRRRAFRLDSRYFTAGGSGTGVGRAPSAQIIVRPAPAAAVAGRFSDLSNFSSLDEAVSHLRARAPALTASTVVRFANPAPPGTIASRRQTTLQRRIPPSFKKRRRCSEMWLSRIAYCRSTICRCVLTARHAHMVDGQPQIDEWRSCLRAAETPYGAGYRRPHARGAPQPDGAPCLTQHFRCTH